MCPENRELCDGGGLQEVWRKHSSRGGRSIRGSGAAERLIHFRLCYQLNVQFNIIYWACTI